MSETKLLRCPCCKGESTVRGFFFVQCKECGLSTLTYPIREKAIEKWNTRKPIQNIVERLEELGKLEITAHGGRCNGKTLTLGCVKGIENAIEIVKEEGRINERNG